VAHHQEPHFLFCRLRRHSAVQGHCQREFCALATARQGVLHCTQDDVNNGVPGCTSTTSTHTVTVDSRVQQYFVFYPTSPDCGADVCQVVFSGQQVIKENFVTTRIDHKFSDKDSLFGTYLFDRTRTAHRIRWVTSNSAALVRGRSLQQKRLTASPRLL